MNIEQTCKDAIAVVERYLAGDLVAADMYDELQEAQDAVDDAWDNSNSRKSNRTCRAAWHACLAAKNDEWSLAKMYVNEYWDRV
tara:strand:+ start:427 stop:678 length:252 start_codon:yes stop_codon:yes gene_type:complete